MNIEVFTNLFQQAIYRVPENYYDTQGHIDEMISWFVSEGDPDRSALRRYFSRHAERPFCYELYHQTRKLMEVHDQQNPSPDPDVSIQLQGEVQKRDIEKVLHHFRNIQGPLRRRYSPDFLLHSARHGDDQHQLVVIEVKTDPKIKFIDNNDNSNDENGSISNDLCKLQQFIERYAYQKGIFLAININHNNLKQMIDENQEWIQQHIRDRSRILLMCKESYEAQLFQLNLEQQEFESIPRPD